MKIMKNKKVIVKNINNDQKNIIKKNEISIVADLGPVAVPKK